MFTYLDSSQSDLGCNVEHEVQVGHHKLWFPTEISSREPQIVIPQQDFQ
jgi:hypothetical protein